MTDREFVIMCQVIRAQAVSSLICQHRKDLEMDKKEIVEKAQQTEETLWKAANKAAKAVDKGVNTYNEVCLNIEKKLFGEPLDEKINRFFNKLFGG